ncbi:hypothetical protein Pla163_26900 [Planctomycetes bacterium Pla163]|uniref:Uncharacterized protein n=1 Tax=Rohdeia mirabilis TaxID=2528008 RepID=A0A518D251_9BACT|nr:hypothetical protein Pla163_26900 [Planctomycetes bacterium Pla163]
MRPNLRSIVASALVFWSLVALAPAQALRERVNEAIDRGVLNLLDEQELDGSWYLHRPRYQAGQTALCMQALLECDVDAGHPAIRRATAYLMAIEPYYTYEVAVTIIAYLELLERLDAREKELDARLRERIGKYVEMLIEYQEPNGGFAYPDRVIDMSNVQYAAMALRNAALAGYDVPQKVWRGIADYTMSVQERNVRGSRPEAGISYVEARPPSGSMTAAGVATLFLCSEQSKRNTSSWVTHREAALRWLAARFTASDNPGQPGAWIYYYLYAVERVGAYLEIDTIGDVPWYEAGATWLVEQQTGSGSWHSPEQTSFALLFLKRATSNAPSTGGGKKSSDQSFGEDDPTAMVSLRGFGENPLRIWISSFGEAESKEYGVESGGTLGGLDVRSVEYWVDSGPGIGDPELLWRTEEDMSANRYVYEHEFARQGTYSVRAVVRIQSPHADEGEVELTSAPLELRARRGDQTRLLQIARNLSRNLFLGQEMRVRASSFFDEDRAAKYAADGTLTSGWLAAAGDRTPFVSLAWNEYFKGGRIEIAHLQPNNAAPVVLPKRLRVTVNGRDEFEVEMPADTNLFGHLEIGARDKVRGLRIDVLSVHEHPEGLEGPVGIGEISYFPPPDED